MELHPIIKLFMRRKTILVAFVLSAVLTTMNTDFSGQESRVLPLLSLVVFPILAWFTYKRALLATWCTVLLLLLTGSGFLYDAFHDLAKADDPGYLLSLLRIAFGVYLTWGALIIHRERHESR